MKRKKSFNNLIVYNRCLILGFGLVAVHVDLGCINYQVARATYNQPNIARKEGKAGFFDLKTTPHLNSAVNSTSASWKT